MKIAIVGAGIAGISAAYYLAKQKYEVEVFEQEPYAAMRTSYANGGQISASNSEVWTTWSNVFNGIKWMLRKDAPLLIRPSPNLDKLSWLAKFLYYTANNDYYTNTKKTIDLALESRLHFENLISKENLKFDYNKCGILHFYKDDKYFQKSLAVKNLYNDNGCEWTILDNSDIKNLEPNLRPIETIIGGAWTSQDSVGDIHEFCNQLIETLSKKYNVRFNFNHIINHINELDSYDAIVIANGIGAKRLAKTVKDNLPIYPIKGYSITIHNNDISNLPKVSLLDDKAKIVTSTLGNRLRIAGTAELNGENYDIRRDRIEPLLHWVNQNLPSVDTRNYSQWACLRPMTPNMMPIYYQSKNNNKVFYHCGHGHLGWTISMATAYRLSKQIENYAR